MRHHVRTARYAPVCFKTDDIDCGHEVTVDNAPPTVGSFVTEPTYAARRPTLEPSALHILL